MRPEISAGGMAKFSIPGAVMARCGQGLAALCNARQTTPASHDG